MNRPPAEFVSLSAAHLVAFVEAVFQSAGVPPDKAKFLAGTLVGNDLRGVFSHGSQQVRAYVDHFRAGRLTPSPEVTVVTESATTVTIDGDGGLGYFPAQLAAERVAEKALEMGVAVALTRNHGHIGAAGIYARVPLARGLFCYVTSGHQLNLRTDQNVLHAAGGSPMSFAIPTRAEPPFVLDFGAVHDMYPGSPHVDEIIRLAPGTVFRCIGMGAVCQAMGGFLAGVPLEEERDHRKWSGANQGSFVIAVDLSRFGPLEPFLDEMDAYSRKVREMVPLEGFDRAMLPGTLEWLREQEYSRHGIPVSGKHADALRKLAEEFHLNSPV